MLENITPQNANHPFWRTKELNTDFINEKREENLRNGRLLNAGFPITEEEENKILSFHRNGWSIQNIEWFFQRSEITIRKIIEKNDLI